METSSNMPSCCFSVRLLVRLGLARQLIKFFKHLKMDQTYVYIFVYICLLSLLFVVSPYHLFGKSTATRCGNVIAGLMWVNVTKFVFRSFMFTFTRRLRLLTVLGLGCGAGWGCRWLRAPLPPPSFPSHLLSSSVSSFPAPSAYHVSASTLIALFYLHAWRAG